MNPKFWGMLGLAQRAGKLAVGQEKAAEAVRNGGAVLLLLAEDASANTEKKVRDMSRFYEVPVLSPGDRVKIGSAIGRESAVVAAVTDSGFSQQLLRLAEME